MKRLLTVNDSEVQTNIYRAFVKLFYARMDLLFGTDALSACEFWLSLSQQISCKDILNPSQLGHLVPFLIKWMRFSDSEIILQKMGVEKIRINAETTDSEHDSGGNVQEEDEKDAGSDGALYDSELSKSLLSLDHILLVKLFRFV